MREKEIREWLAALEKAYGPARPHVNATELVKRYYMREYASLIRYIADSLGVSSRLRVGYVRSGGPQNAAAWINKVPHMPMFGTRAFRDFVFTIHIRRQMFEQLSFAPVTFVIAHEITHIVLDSTYHPLADVEEVVDLAAMYLGYADIFVSGSEYIALGTPQALFKDLPLDSFEGFIDGTAVALEELMPTRRMVGYLSSEEYELARALIKERR